MTESGDWENFQLPAQASGKSQEFILTNKQHSRKYMKILKEVLSESYLR